MKETGCPTLYIEFGKCCGCGACLAACAKNAIYMVEDKMGFLYPHIYENKCVSCNLCITICPLKD